MSTGRESHLEESFKGGHERDCVFWQRVSRTLRRREFREKKLREFRGKVARQCLAMSAKRKGNFLNCDIARPVFGLEGCGNGEVPGYFVTTS